MQTGYFVVAKDGKEYGPLDRDTIQQWYFEGRINRGSRVWEPNGHKFRLHEMFDLTLWSNPSAINHHHAQSEPTFQSNILGIPNERTPGMLAAAVLLLISGIVELLVVLAAFALSIPLKSNGMIYLTGAAVADLIVAAGLFIGNQKFRGWGLGRAVLGGVLVILAALISSASAAEWIFVGFQVLVAGGIASLLATESPSKIRVGAGVAAVLVAWSGMITTGLVMIFFISTRAPQVELERYAETGAGAFEDTSLGVKVRMPIGWELFTGDNPVMTVPDATFVAAHGRVGCVAALTIEPAIFEVGSLDEYVDLVVETRREELPTYSELSRTDLQFGGNPGRRLETVWTFEGTKIHGFTTVCMAGSSYYLLTGWCLDSVYETAFPEFQSLESAFQISGTPPLQVDQPYQSTPSGRDARSRATSR